MADKIATVTEYSREDFFDPFARALSKEFQIIEEDKPNKIRFGAGGTIKDGTIEFRPLNKGFDVYVEMKFSAIMFGASFALKKPAHNYIISCINTAKRELASAPAKSAAGMKYCLKCGAQLPSDAAYCQKCGTKQP